MMSKVLFILVLKLKGSMTRLVIRDDKEELKNYIANSQALKLQNTTVDTVAEYNFEHKIFKYYSLDKFLRG